MRIFNKLFRKKNRIEEKLGNYTVKLNLTDRQLELFDEILDASTARYENLCRKLTEQFVQVVIKLDNMNSYFKELCGCDFGKIAAAAVSMAETEKAKLVEDQKKRLDEFEKTQKKLTDAEKEELFTRTLLLLKTDTEKWCPKGNQIWGEDAQKIYNNLRKKHGLKPVEMPKAEIWTPVTDEKSTNEEPKKQKTPNKKGKKNGKKPGRNRKAKAAGSGNAVSPNEKLANGQG